MNLTGIVVFVVLTLSASAALAQSAKPPPIPHAVDGYVVTRAENNCLECHDKPRDIGRKRAKGQSVPLPISHYGGKLDAKPAVAGSHFNCTSCHAAR